MKIRDSFSIIYIQNERRKCYEVPIYLFIKKNNDGYYITNSVPFSPMGNISIDTVKAVFKFAYAMSFGHSGEHRAHRSGGKHNRKLGEIFANAFQGKLADCALYSILKKRGSKVDKLDFGVHELGKGDTADLTIGYNILSIKSTKSFGNLLLLETRDYDSNGTYIPNNTSADFTFLVRMKPYCEELMEKHHILYSDKLDVKLLEKLMLKEQWDFDIPGYITKSDLSYIINNNYVIPQAAKLNGRIEMDADNYYVQSGDMKKLL